MAKAGKKRADVLVHERGLTRSREEARRSIMAGLVHLANRRVDKPGELLPEDADIQLKEKLHPFVGRGGLKLDHALDVFGIDMVDRVCADIGASTGGFTDCMLKRGARKVYAVDAGTNQLDFKLRQDDRVVVMENVNARYLEDGDLGDPVSFICMDVSFISVKRLIPVFPRLMEKESPGDVVILVKPQFEVGREEVEKKGIIRDRKKHERVIREIAAFSAELGLVPAGLTRSPITGSKGNTEYLLHLHWNRPGATLAPLAERIQEVVYHG